MNDFAHRISLADIRDGDRVDLVADEAERTLIARRLDLVALDRLEAHAVLRRDGDRISASGRLKASLQQSCVASGDPVAARIDEPFELLFAPEPKVDPDSEIELGAGDLDTVFHDGAGIELGAAIADTLALALDPYPRSASAETALRQAGVLQEQEVGPFAALAALKGKLGG
jgi:uncharacterized metal-binding protein YceD (DUF177 family)